MPMNQPTRERASLLFAALSNPTRLRIVELLCSQDMSANQICDALRSEGKSLGSAQSATSQNLAKLTRAGILKVEQQGASRIYGIRGPRIPRILALIEEFCQVHQLYGFADEAEENLKKDAP